MLFTHRLRLVGYFLFCTQAFVFTSFGLAQVGIAWAPSYATEHSIHGSGAISGRLGPRPLRNRTTALDIDLSDPNDVQRRNLFEFYNANRYEVYSADGVSGWNTSHSWNPIRNSMRRRESDLNLSGNLGIGTYHVDPFVKRSSHAVALPPSYPAPVPNQQPQERRNDLPKTNAAPPPAIDLPNMEDLRDTTSPDLPLQDAWPSASAEPSNPIDELHEEGNMTLPSQPLPPQFPPPADYEDVAPEFEWDESLLDDLPEFNSAIIDEPPSADTSNLKVTGYSDQGSHSTSIDAQNPLQAAIQLESSGKGIKPLKAAIQLQTGTRINQRINALQAAIRLESLTK